MITYVTRAVINDANDFKYLYGPDVQANENGEITADPIGLKIAGHWEFDFDYFQYATVQLANDEVLAEVEIDLAGDNIANVMEDSKVMRFVINLIPDDVYPSEYALGDTTFGKPVIFEFETCGDAEKAAKNAEKVMKKYNLMGETLVTVKADGTKLTFTASKDLDFKEIVLGVDCKEGSIVRFENVELEEDVDITKVTKHVSETGSYNKLAGLLRLPTASNYGWGMPEGERNLLPGAKYACFTIVMCADRGPIGAAHIGQVIHSETAHVFYVNEASVESMEGLYEKLESKIKMEVVGEEGTPSFHIKYTLKSGDASGDTSDDDTSGQSLDDPEDGD